MTSSHLPPGPPIAAAGFRQVRPCLADGRQRALELAQLRGFRR